MRKKPILSMPLLLLLLAAGQPGAGNQAEPIGNQTEPAGNAATPAEPDGIKSVGQSAGRIASQPARDVGVAKTRIPPALVEASNDPYSVRGLKTCKNIAAAFHAMTDVLGPDFKAGEIKKENRAGKLAEAGGQTVVNSLIPFRGLVREVTGAAPAQRRLNRALDAGYARRGFLRGLYTARKCKSPVLF